MVAFFSGSDVSVTESDGTVVVSLGEVERELTRAEAAAFRRAVGDAIAGREELYRTVGEFRADGSYVVARRGADSDGNAKVFEDFAAVAELYDRLPPTFDAEDVGDVASGADGDGTDGDETAITGSRRHMLVRHFAEHPAFDCAVVCRNPLRAEKAGDGGGVVPDGTADEDATETAEGTVVDDSRTDAAPAEVGSD